MNNKDNKEILPLERIKICYECENLLPYIKICKICKCIMPLKVRFKKESCPINKW